MGLVGILRSFVRVVRKTANASDVKLDPGGGPLVTGQHFAPPGDDSHPLPDDYLYAASVRQRGRVAVLGYVDPTNTPKAQQGEKRLYARDSSGAVVVEIWLKNSGEATVFNENGDITLAPDGSVTAQNTQGSVTLGADGSILGQNASGSFELQAGGDFVVNGVTIDTTGLITTPTGVVTPSALVNGVEVDQHNHLQGNDSAGNTEQPTGPMQ